jgi:glycosyltransferase involved in cell wall biosynthesis
MQITVLVTAYNVADYVESALNSVMEQTRQPDRIIVVDDGSTDATPQILKLWGRKIEYIRSENNLGVLPATVKGLEMISDGLVCFLDGDDIWCADKLELVEAAFSQNDSLMILTHNYTCIDANGESRSYTSDKTNRNMRNIYCASCDSSSKSDAFKRSILSYKGYWLGSAWSIRRCFFNLESFKSFIKSVRFPAYENLSHQDQPIAAFMIVDEKNKNYEIDYIDKNLFFYRIHSNNTSGSVTNVSGVTRSALRSYATLYGTHQIVSAAPHFRFELKNQLMLLTRAHCIYYIYSGKKFSEVFDSVLNLVDILGWKLFIGILVRYFCLLTFGMNLFVLIKRIRHRLK